MVRKTLTDVKNDESIVKPLSLNRKRIIVSGAGLLGTTVFAFLSEHQELDVILAEAGPEYGGGTTAKNHGRIHCGATGVYSDPDQVTERKIRGNRVTCALDEVLENNMPAVYCCENGFDYSKFNITCLDRRISVSRLSSVKSPINLHNWVNADKIGTCFSVPEYSFNPSSLAQQICAVGNYRNGKSYTNSKVKTLRREGGKLVASIEAIGGGTEDVRADFFVNCNSKYANSISFEDRSSLLDIEFFMWPVMSIPSRLLKGKLQHVIVYVDKKGIFPSMIPHKDTITFDAKTIPSKTDAPDNYPKKNPKVYDGRIANERKIFDAVKMVFKPFSEMRKTEFARHVSVFYGIHGRRKGETETSDISRLFRYSDVENYVVVHGGIATTAILDAMEAVREIEDQIGVSPLSDAERVGHLNRDLNQLRRGTMIWTKQPS